MALFIGMREIRALPITCNKECGWEGTVSSLDEHLGTCDFVLVPCPKQCTEADSKVADILRKDLDEHLKKHCPNRDHECSDCGEKGTYADITQDHHKVCAKKPLPCPNAGCGDIVERQQVPEHVSKCPHTVIPCKYKGIGCDAELERKDMAAHEQDDKLHLHMALDTVMSQQDAIKQQQVAIYMLQDTTKQQVAINSDAIKPLQRTTFALSDYRKKKETNVKFISPSFYTSPNGYCIRVIVYANGYRTAMNTHLSVFVDIRKGTERKQQIKGNVTFALMNQLRDVNHHKVVTPFVHQNEERAVAGMSNFIRHSALARDPVTNTQYLKDDTLYFRVEVQLDDYKPWLECTTIGN